MSVQYAKCLSNKLGLQFAEEVYHASFAYDLGPKGVVAAKIGGLRMLLPSSYVELHFTKAEVLESWVKYIDDLESKASKVHGAANTLSTSATTSTSTIATATTDTTAITATTSTTTSSTRKLLLIIELYPPFHH